MAFKIGYVIFYKRMWGTLIGILFSWFPTFLIGQSFGPISQSLVYADFRNPALPALLWRNAEFEKWNAGGTISPTFNPENNKNPDHIAAFVSYNFPETIGSWKLQLKLMAERNAIGPVQHLAGQVGARVYKRLKDGRNPLAVSGGVNLGIRNWRLRDAPNLRPWDFGDPLLAVQGGNKAGGISYFFSSGFAVYGSWKTGNSGEAPQIEYTLGVSSEFRPGKCNIMDCYTFSTSLAPTDFTDGRMDFYRIGTPQINTDLRFSKYEYEVFISSYWQQNLRSNFYGVNVGGVIKPGGRDNSRQRFTFMLGFDQPGPNYRFLLDYSSIPFSLKGGKISLRMKIGLELIVFPGDQFRAVEYLQHFSMTNKTGDG